MKTLKLISLSILLVAVVAIASAKETNSVLINSTSDLKNSLREQIESDFSESNGFLYQNDISKMDENVELIFLITPDQTVRVLEVKSKNELASEYIKQLLNKKPLRVSTGMIGTTYRVDIQLVYRAN